jgi:hypothetical protein
MKSHTGANTKKVIYLRAAKIAAQNNKVGYCLQIEK